MKEPLEMQVHSSEVADSEQLRKWMAEGGYQTSQDGLGIYRSICGQWIRVGEISMNLCLINIYR